MFLILTLIIELILLAVFFWINAWTVLGGIGLGIAFVVAIINALTLDYKGF